MYQADFRYFFSAQFLSYIGTWMQDTAKTWIILGILGGTATSVGILMFATAIPNVFFLSLAGGLADRVGPRKVLVFTQVALALTSALLGVFVFTGVVSFPLLVALAFVEGVAVAFDVPAFNLVTPRLVERKDFQQSLALNSVAFHLSRVLGPAVAGVVLAKFGVEEVFFVNALSFLLIVHVIRVIKFREPELKHPDKKDSGTLREVFRFLRNHPLFFRIMCQFMLVMTLLFPLVFTTLRVILKTRLVLTEAEFGYFMAAPGLGALLGSMCFLAIKPKNPYTVLPYGLAGIVVFLLMLAETHTRFFMGLNTILFSFCMFLTMSALLVTVQLRVEERIRGRVSALIGFSFVAVSPIMAVPVGLLTDLWGARSLIWVVAISFSVLTLGLYYYTRHHRISDAEIA